MCMLSCFQTSNVDVMDAVHLTGKTIGIRYIIHNNKQIVFICFPAV